MLKDRIEILQGASVISSTTGDYVKKVIDMIESEFSDKENILEMFTTHLAMATQRILDHGDLETLDESIWKEVVNTECFSLAENKFHELTAFSPCEFPEGEKRFLMMHICNLYQK